MKKYEFREEEFTLLEQLPIPLGVYQFLDKRVVTRVLSEGFCRLFDFPTREDAYQVMTNDMYSTAHPDDAARVADAAYRFATRGGVYEVVYRVRTRTSSVYRIVHAVGEHRYMPDGSRLAFVHYTDEGSYTGQQEMQNKTLRNAFREALHRESMIQAGSYDYLTGLPNMSYFLELLAAGRRQLIQEGKTPAVLFINLNGMKSYNRRYGFSQGDQLLRQISRILVGCFTAENCSRFAQDHFAVFTQSEGLEERLQQVISQCSAANDGRTLSVRIGVYVEGKEQVEPSAACDRAKVACDSLKNSFLSGYAWFDQHMLTEAEHRQDIIDHLDQALEEGWVNVYYQPIVRTASGKVCDEEALARWIDPVKGLLPPSDFIPILEDARLIYKLDLYVVERVLVKLKDQAAAGLHLVPQSVNLSRSDFDACDMVEEIRRRVDASGIGRDKLTIEITESVVGSDFAFMKEQVSRFQQLGFEVWMDDFGSGYSSLDMLQDIRFDLIKFDMRFMQRFGEREESRVILTELTRMAMGLGIDTVCEGVETREQVSFLREIGCTKLQGFYFCKPVPLEEIVERNRKGIQIGFEDPREMAYFAAIGRINLYDTAVFAREDQDSLKNYFNTIPMAIIESTEETFTIVRCNSTYRSFMTRTFGKVVIGRQARYEEIPIQTGRGFLRALQQCGRDGQRLVIDEQMSDGATVHAMLKRVAVNPVKGTSALAVAVLAVIAPNSTHPALSYAQIANALSSDYFDLFCVDLETEAFSQYSSALRDGNLEAERHGADFFQTSRTDALRMLYREDQPFFLRSFTRENVIRAMDDHGAFTLTYRLMMDGEPVYVNMKAVRMQGDRRHIIIGVNNVNAQMKEKLAREQLEEERITFSRIAALAGDFICIYTVDMESNRYLEYSATSAYEGLGIAKEGEDFFRDTQENGKSIIWQEDWDWFSSQFTKERMLEEIRRTGVYELQYRLVLEDRPTYVAVKGAIVQEKGGPRLVVGVTNIDARVRKQ